MVEKMNMFGADIVVLDVIFHAPVPSPDPETKPIGERLINSILKRTLSIKRSDSKNL
jgi:hypothetical protein